MPALQQEDFPVAFAETRDYCQQTDDDSTVFYVEWLDNSSEFPGLATPTNTNLTGGNWELLQRKEVIPEETDHAVVPVEDSWSKIIRAEEHPLYADMVEKNAAELQPKKRVVQPLWPNVQLSNKKSQEDTTEKIDSEELYEQDLGTELYDDLKSQSRRSNYLSRRRNLHTLTVTDYHVQGILRIATRTKGWISAPVPEGVVDYSAFLTVKMDRTTTEAEAKRYNSRHSHNRKRYTWRLDRKKPQIVDDLSEFNVLSAIAKRY
jgi:hypothetical protein